MDLLYQIVKFDTPHDILSRIFDLTSILASIEVVGGQIQRITENPFKSFN